MVLTKYNKNNMVIAKCIEEKWKYDNMEEEMAKKWE